MPRPSPKTNWIKRLEENRNLAIHRQFIKATQGMSSQQRDTYVDRHVMGYVHSLLHDAQDLANGHNAAITEQAQHQQGIVDSKAKQADQKKRLKGTLDKLSKEFGDFRLTDPGQVPEVQHILESHPVVPSVVQAIVNGQMNSEQGAAHVLQNIGAEPPHDKADITSSVFQKATLPGVVGDVYSPPTGLGANARSAYRSSPPFLVDTTITPDERFIKYIMLAKQVMGFVDGKGEYPLRPVKPVDQAHEALEQKIGIPSLVVTADGSISEKTYGDYLKALAFVEKLDARYRARH